MAGEHVPENEASLKDVPEHNITWRMGGQYQTMDTRCTGSGEQVIPDRQGPTIAIKCHKCDFVSRTRVGK